MTTKETDQPEDAAPPQPSRFQPGHAKPVPLEAMAIVAQAPGKSFLDRLQPGRVRAIIEQATAKGLGDHPFIRAMQERAKLPPAAQSEGRRQKPTHRQKPTRRQREARWRPIAQRMAQSLGDDAAAVCEALEEWNWQDREALLVALRKALAGTP
jgi:hypothetical protein